MEHREEIGFQVHMLSHLMKRIVDRKVFQGRENPVTGMQGRVIGYLYANRDRDVFQRDIQSQFSVRRSTVTGILQLMEKNGLIVRLPVERDARLKKLELTPLAVQMHDAIGRGIAAVEECAAAGLTAEEKETFISLCEKIRGSILAQLESCEERK